MLVTALLTGFTAALLAQPEPGLDKARASSSSLEAARNELNDAKAELRALQAKLDKLAQKGEQAEAKLDQTRGRIEEVQTKLSKTEKDLARAQEQLAGRLVDMYKNRGSEAYDALNTVFGGEDISLSTVVQRLVMVSRVAGQDRDLVVAVETKLGEFRELASELRDQKKAEEAGVAENMAAHDQAIKVLEESRSDYDRLKKRVAQLQAEEQKRQEEARRLAEARAAKARAAAEAAATAKAAAAKSPSGAKRGGPVVSTNRVVDASAGWVFPVQGPNSFIDTFGAPRSGGRTHKGTDIITPLNTAVVAVVNGVISATKPYESGLGGITIHLRGNDGNTYYYAHLTSVKSGITKGVRVTAGEIIGFAGNTGNARGGETHLHFEIRPGGGAAVNPYPTLVKYR